MKLLSRLQEGFEGGSRDTNELRIVVRRERDRSFHCLGKHDVEVVPEGEAGDLFRDS